MNTQQSTKKIEWAQISIIVLFSFTPLFVNLPFKINLFLAWEGAYRLSLGQIPYKDFSLPTGFGFWLIPAFFFKVFGPYLYSLLLAQAFINSVGALAFRAILKKLGADPPIVFISLLVYCISFILVNFWPWYNNSVYIFELVGINFMLAHIFEKDGRNKIIFLPLSCFFFILSFFTKQDGGGLAILTASALIFYDALVEKKMKWVFYYIGFSTLFTLIFVLPFIPFNFLDSFNYGQAPHNSRANLNDFLIDIFEGSQWIKFYLLIIVVTVILKANAGKDYLFKKKELLFAILTFCILCQALIIQVTSYIPHNVNIYFHSMGFAFVAYTTINSSLKKTWILTLTSLLILFWWSADYWRYGQRIINRISPGLLESQRSSNQISKYTWQIIDSIVVENKTPWRLSSYKSFKNVLLPEETIKGIDDLTKMDVLKNKNIKVLNMSELTPLAYELGFEPLKDQPLWFHKNVSIFDQEISQFCKKIEHQEYDLVLFEVIPYLNNFYPQEVRSCLKINYNLVNSFKAPREKSGAFIEVYIKR
jgi:hypothetical protein